MALHSAPAKGMESTGKRAGCCLSSDPIWERFVGICFGFVLF